MMLNIYMIYSPTFACSVVFSRGSLVSQFDNRSLLVDFQMHVSYVKRAEYDNHRASEPVSIPAKPH